MKTTFTDMRHPSHNRLGLEDLASTQSDWLAAFSTRAGPLVPASRRFMREHFGAASATFPGCASLLRELARAMQRWLTHEDVDADAERHFVEGAGAVLGVILVAHVGDASHVARGNLHRVRLRQYGFFDPFAAIDRALDADQVRQALAVEVACAEAEASGHGPVARVVAALARALSECGSDLRIREQFEGLVTLESARSGESIELDLQRAIDTTRDQPAAAVEQVARRYLSMLPGAAPQAESFELLRPRLYPRIVRCDVLADLSQSGRSVLFSAPLVADLAVALMVQEQGRARYVRLSEAEAFPLPAAQLLEAAVHNLRECSVQTRLVPVKDTQGVFVSRTGDGRDTARVLLPSLFSALRSKLGEHLCVGLPHRDAFMVCAAGDERAVRNLAVRVADDAARAPHKLSCELFLLQASGLRPYA